MKLLFAIIQNDDEKKLTRELVGHGFRVTKVSSSGGFLHAGNVTLMVGVEKARLQDALDIIRKSSHKRKSLTPLTMFPTSSADQPPIPIEVNVGGATVFVVDVEAFHKF